MENRVLTWPVLNGAKTVENRGRDERGRFLPGAPPGPGRPKNPFARRQAAMRQVMQEAVTDADIRAIARKVIELALAGNPSALQLYFEYVMGPLPTPVHPDRLDEDERRVQQAAPTPMEQGLLAERQEEMSAADAAASWQTFADRHLEWAERWTAPLTYLLDAYRDWCQRQDEPVWPQAEIEAWLTQQGATVRGGDRPAVLGLRVVE